MARQLSDEEISLIKGMLQRGMKNDLVHFHFNRPERLISSGRIAQIKRGVYGGTVAPADDEALDRFLTEFQRKAGGYAPPPPTTAFHVESHFDEHGGGWRLKSEESDIVECKLSFRLTPDHRFADVIKSIAGMANNRGGIIFFGVQNGTRVVQGLADDSFSKADPATINRILASALDPVPLFSKSTETVGAFEVGVLRVQKHTHAPVIALKNIGGGDLREGTIYYRYVGETRSIKPGELRHIIAVREQNAVAEFSRRMVNVAAGTVATLDLETGEVAGTTGTFLIDKELLPDIQFIREGDFSEIKGAPALRLMGDVQPIDKAARDRARIIRDSVTPDAALVNFLQAEAVASPSQYVCAQVHFQRKWVPLWYYVKKSGKTPDALIAELKTMVPTYPASRDAIVDRLLKKSSAFKVHPGRPAEILKKILAGEDVSTDDPSEHIKVAYAIMGLPNDFREADGLKPILLKAFNASHDRKSATTKSAIFRAASRLDELLFR